MGRFNDSMTLRQAREQFFKLNGFSESAYTEKWSEVNLGPLPLVVPNPPMRQRAIPLHDLHHIVTGYDTDIKGEGEIGAWELASGGAGKYPLGWPYILSITLLAFILHPKAIIRAYQRGRSCQNLFKSDFKEELLSKTVGDLRRELRIA
jgi:hypothetical protein